MKQQRFHSPAVRKLSLALSPYSAERGRKTQHTHTHALVPSFPRSFFPLHILLLLLLSSVMNGRYEFSAASPGLALRPSAAEQTETLSKLSKGAIRNSFEPRWFWACLCTVLKRAGRNVENGFF